MSIEKLFAISPEFEMTPEEARAFLKDGVIGPFLLRTSALFNKEPYDPGIDLIPVDPRPSRIVADTRAESLV